MRHGDGYMHFHRDPYRRRSVWRKAVAEFATLALGLLVILGILFAATWMGPR